jgi:hypothetical protein
LLVSGCELSGMGVVVGEGGLIHSLIHCATKTLGLHSGGIL